MAYFVTHVIWLTVWCLSGPYVMADVTAYVTTCDVASVTLYVMVHLVAYLFAVVVACAHPVGTQ